MSLIGSSPYQRERRKWTEEEDNVLYEEIGQQLNRNTLYDWNRIAIRLPGRTNKDCRKRWMKIQSTDINKGAWTSEEDTLLRTAVETYGCSWTKVAQTVGTRQADQCAKRWQHYLDPCLDHSEWAPNEDSRLIEAVKTYGKNWKTISDMVFPGRSANNIKNRHSRLDRQRQAGTRLALPAATFPPLDGQSSSFPSDLLPLPLDTQFLESYAEDHANPNSLNNGDEDAYCITSSVSDFRRAQSGDNQQLVLQSGALPSSENVNMLRDIIQEATDLPCRPTNITSPAPPADFDFMVDEEPFSDSQTPEWSSPHTSAATSQYFDISSQSSLNDPFDGRRASASRNNLTSMRSGAPFSDYEGAEIATSQTTRPLVPLRSPVAPPSTSLDNAPTIPTVASSSSATDVISGGSTSGNRRTLVLQDVHPQLFGRIVTLLMEEGSGLRIASL